MHMDYGSSIAAGGENKQAADKEDDVEPDDDQDKDARDVSEKGVWTHARAHNTIHNHTLLALTICYVFANLLITS